MNNVWFEPFVGNDYWGNGYNGKRILIIGNSHYCKDRDSCSCCGIDGCGFDGNSCSSFTIDSITERYNAQDKFADALGGYDIGDYDDYMNEWNKVVFYNFLQTAVRYAKDRGRNCDYEESYDAFWEVLENFRPDGIIFWGNRVWNMAPDYNGDDCYELGDGTEIPALQVCHPAAWANFNYENVHNEIQDFVNNL